MKRKLALLAALVGLCFLPERSLASPTPYCESVCCEVGVDMESTQCVTDGFATTCQWWWTYSHGGWGGICP